MKKIYIWFLTLVASYAMQTQAITIINSLDIPVAVRLADLTQDDYTDVIILDPDTNTIIEGSWEQQDLCYGTPTTKVDLPSFASFNLSLRKFEPDATYELFFDLDQFTIKIRLIDDSQIAEQAEKVRPETYYWPESKKEMSLEELCTQQKLALRNQIREQRKKLSSEPSASWCLDAKPKKITSRLVNPIKIIKPKPQSLSLQTDTPIMSELDAAIQDHIYRETYLIPYIANIISRSDLRRKEFKKSEIGKFTAMLWQGIIPSKDDMRRFLFFVSQTNLHLLHGYQTNDDFIAITNILGDETKAPINENIQKLIDTWKPGNFTTDESKLFAKNIQKILNFKLELVVKKINLAKLDPAIQDSAYRETYLIPYITYIIASSPSKLKRIKKMELEEFTAMLWQGIIPSQTEIKNFLYFVSRTKFHLLCGYQTKTDFIAANISSGPTGTLMNHDIRRLYDTWNPDNFTPENRAFVLDIQKKIGDKIKLASEIMDAAIIEKSRMEYEDFVDRTAAQAQMEKDPLLQILHSPE